MGIANPAAPATTSAPARLVATVALVAGTGGSVISLLVDLSTVGRPGSYSTTPFGDLAAFTFAVTLLALGFVLRSRRPANSIGWLFLAFGVVATLSSVAWATMQVGFLPGGDRRIGAIAAWLGSVGSILTWTYLIAAVILRFPHGEPASRSEGRLLRWLPAICVVAAGTAALRPGPMLIYLAFDNPVSTPSELHGLLTALSNLALVVILVPAFVAVVAIVRRYRGATSVERLQLRWFAFGASVGLLATAVYIVFGVIVAADNPIVREGTYALFVASLSALPIAVFQAITSHRLYDIDRIIGRTFAYGALTAIVAGLYAASIRLFSWLFVTVTGEESEAALVLTTLVLATTFTPIKSRLEKIAEGRFKPTADEAARAGAASAAPDEPAGASSEAFSSEQLAALEARIEAVVRRVAQEGRARPPRA